jgi:Biotin-requiring enzyme
VRSTLEEHLVTGDVIAMLEAMKTETVLHAPRDEKIAEILVSPGQQIDARDLVMRIEYTVWVSMVEEFSRHTEFLKHFLCVSICRPPEA